MDELRNTYQIHQSWSIHLLGQSTSRPCHDWLGPGASIPHGTLYPEQMMEGVEGFIPTAPCYWQTIQLLQSYSSWCWRQYCTCQKAHEAWYITIPQIPCILPRWNEKKHVLWSLLMHLALQGAKFHRNKVIEVLFSALSTRGGLEHAISSHVQIV